MGKRNGKERQLPPSEELLALLETEVAAVAPTDPEVEPRFKNFRISPEIREKVKRAIAAFEAGVDERVAALCLEAALTHLRNSQFAFFRNAEEREFNPELEKMREAHVEQDLIARARKHVKALHDFLVSHRGLVVDLAEAGRIYNETRRAVFFRVWDEWRARLENRHRKMGVVSEEERERARKASRAAEAARLSTLRERRAAQSAGLRERIAALG